MKTLGPSSPSFEELTYNTGGAPPITLNMPVTGAREGDWLLVFAHSDSQGQSQSGWTGTGPDAFDTYVDLFRAAGGGDRAWYFGALRWTPSVPSSFQWSFTNTQNNTIRAVGLRVRNAWLGSRELNGMQTLGKGPWEEGRQDNLVDDNGAINVPIAGTIQVPEKGSALWFVCCAGSFQLNAGVWDTPSGATRVDDGTVPVIGVFSDPDAGGQELSSLGYQHTGHVNDWDPICIALGLNPTRL